MKLCFPNFGALGPVLETLCRQEKLDYVPPSQNLEEALVIGSRLAPEGVCLPMKRMLGEFVQAAGQGADTVLFLGGSGPCRFGYFAPLFQTIFDQKYINMKVVAMEAPSGDRMEFHRLQPKPRRPPALFRLECPVLAGSLGRGAAQCVGTHR